MTSQFECLLLEQRFDFNDQAVAWGFLGDGPPVVLVHGFPWSSQAWRKIAPWLARERTVYYFDMIGCGQSSKGASQNVSETVQSDLLEALISHWGLKQPQLIGHDFGGLAVLRGHFVNGIDCSAIQLIDPVAILPSGSPFYTHVAKHESAFAELPAYAHEALFQAYIQQAAHYPLRAEATEIYASPWRGEIGQAAFYRQIAQSSIDNISEAQSKYCKCDFPVHLIWGEYDTFIPIEQGQKLHRLLSADTLTAVPNAAHIIHEDAPEALLGALLANI